MSSSELAGRALAASAPLLRRARRAALLRRIAVLAAAAGATVDADIALDAAIGPRVRVSVAPGTASRLRIGPQTRLGDGVVLQLKGGSIDLAGWVDLRRGVVLNVSGQLRIGEASMLGAGTTVHCAATVAVGDRVATGEYVTLVDSSHVHREPGRPLLYDVATGAVTVGDDTFLGAKATLTRSASVGAWCIVGAGSVVTGPVADRSFVSGVPAVFVREVDLPWE